MAPRVLPDRPVSHPKVALIAQPDPDPEPGTSSQFEDRTNPRWLRIPAAVKYSGINRSRLFKLLAEGVVRSASLKERRGAKRGLRLVDRFSLDLFLETLAKPVEERLVAQANELRLQEEELSKEQEVLGQKQRAIERELDKVRKRSRK